MKSIKIVQKFFSEAQAVSTASYQRAKAKKEGQVILKVDKIDAYKLFNMNGWFKKNPFEKIGYPKPGDFMVIVYYNCNVVPAKSSTLKKKIVKAIKEKSVATSFKVVRLNKEQGNLVSSAYKSFVSNTTMPACKFRYRTTFSIGNMEYRSISFTPPTYRCQVAA